MKNLLSLTHEAIDQLNLSDEQKNLLADQFESVKYLVQTSILKVLTGKKVKRLEANVSYFWEYKLKPLDKQIAILEDSLSLNGKQAREYAESLKEQSIVGAEGYFAIPTLKALSPEGDYLKACKMLLKKIEKKESMVNYGPIDRLDGLNIEVTERTASALALLESRQPGDILIVPAQLGELHLGEEILYSQAILPPQEIAIDLFSILGVLISHPERFGQSYLWGTYNEPLWDQISMICSGNSINLFINSDQERLYVNQIENDTKRKSGLVTFFI